MKGLLKGLRYITQIFEAKEEEPEIRIGNPTDVKHVAHIGWDSASVTNQNPTWMNEFKGEAEGGGGAEPPQAGNIPEQPGGGGEKADQADKPRRTRGKGTAGSEAKRRDGGDGPRRQAKAEGAESCDGESAAPGPKQRRRKPKPSGQSKPSSADPSGGPASDPEAA